MKKILSIVISFNLVCAAIFCVPFTAVAIDVPTSAENGIPLLVINVDESNEAIAAASADDSSHTYGTIDDMNCSSDHSVRCVGDVTIDVPDGFVSEYGSSSVPTGSIKMKYMRGRGNTTWQSQKKPYKIEFTEAVDLFGMGASTDWALMANSNDDTLLRNRITSALGNSIGMPYCPQSVPVDVVMKGTGGTNVYLGSYTLSETVKIEESRLNIKKLKKNTVAEDEITGGYLLSIYTEFQNGDEPDSNHFKTDSGIELITKSPEYTSESLTDGQRAQRTYIQNYVKELDNLIMNSEMIDEETHALIAKKLDLTSVADYWWIQEFCENGDAYGTSSTYFYKDRGGKLCFGPLWDFDIAWRLYNNEVGDSLKGFNNTEMKWVDQLRDKDPLFVELLKQEWYKINDMLAEFTSDGGKLNRYSTEIKASWEKNSKIWSVDNEYANWYPQESFEEIIDSFKNGIEGRRAWINANLGNIDTVFHTLTFKVDGKVSQTLRVRDRSHVYKAPEAPDKKGYVFKCWLDEESGEQLEDIAFEKDSTIVANYVKESKETTPAKIYFECYETWREINDSDCFGVYTKAIPDTAVVGKIQWSSTNESVAVYSEEDDVFFIKGVGDTTITATLRNGVKNSLVLHVYDKNVTPAVPVSDVKIDAPKIIDPGDYTQIKTVLLPQGQPIDTLGAFYETSDEDIIDLDMSSGVIKALKPGKAKITITVRNSWDDNSAIIRKTIEITVEHTPDKGTVTKKPTYTATGIKTYKCAVCGEIIKTETLPKLPKKKNTLKAKGRTVKLSAKELKKKKLTVSRKKAITVKKAKGRVTFKKLKGNKKIVINKKTGKITVKKGLKKGTYKVKIKVTSAGDENYEKLAKTVTVKIKLK